MLTVRGVASAIIGTGSKFISLPSAHRMALMAGRIPLCLDYISMVCEHAVAYPGGAQAPP